MKNLGNMLKQAQEMQGRMAAMQEELERREVTGRVMIFERQSINIVNLEIL